VQAADVINVPQSGMFFVSGLSAERVRTQLAQTYTFTQALTVCRGVDGELAAYGEIAIFRRRDGLEAEKIPVNPNEIFAGKARDPLIAPDERDRRTCQLVQMFVKRFIGGIGLPGIPTP